MEKSVCKLVPPSVSTRHRPTDPRRYPFIVLCVVVGLVVLSALLCLIRCVMCGYACCSCCCGGCGGRRHKSEHTTTYVLPPPAHHGPVIDRPPAPLYDEPKYAYFESSPDALPHMPSAHGVEVKRPVTVVEEHEMTPVSGIGGSANDVAPRFGSAAGYAEPYDVVPERSGSTQDYAAGSRPYGVAPDRPRSPGGASVYASSTRTAQPPPAYQPQYGDTQYGNTRAFVPPQQQHGYEEDMPAQQYRHPNQHQHQHQQQQQRGYEVDMPAEPYLYGHQQQPQQQDYQHPAYQRAYDDRRRQEEWSGV